MSGRKPRGWRAPLYNFSDRSLDFLIARGFTYDASLMGDDIPYLIESRATGKRLVEIPSHRGLDDWPQYVHAIDLDYVMPVRAPSQGFAVYVQEFESAYRHGGLWVPVVHPFASGRLSRWDVFAQFLEKVLARGDVWFAPMRRLPPTSQRSQTPARTRRVLSLSRNTIARLGAFSAADNPNAGFHLSGHRGAAVRTDALASEKRRSRTGKEEDRGRNLFGPPDPAQQGS